MKPSPSSTPASARQLDGGSDEPDTHRPRPKRRARRGHGSLLVQSKSADDGRYLWANVYLDGAWVGRTVLTLERVRAGVHRVEVRRAGYRPQRRSVRVHVGKTVKVAFALPPLGD